MQCLDILAGVVAVAVVSLPTWAEDVAPSAPVLPTSLTFDAAPPTAPAREPFSRGTWALSLTTSYLGDIDSHTRENLYSGAVGINYYLLDKLAVRVELPVYGISQDGPDTIGTGFNLLFRYHFWTYEKWSLYADGGAGLLVTGKQVPDGGTYLNFVPKGGVGFTYAITPDVFLEAGARVAHISNGGIRGSAHNPSMNIGMEGYVGVMIPF